jgi:integrase
MVMTAGCLELRISEILGLQWRDVDWDNLVVQIQRSVVEGKVYETKTEVVFRSSWGVTHKFEAWQLVEWHGAARSPSYSTRTERCR